MSEPAQIMSELDVLTAELGQATTDLYNKQEEFDKLAELYDDTFNDCLTTLLDEYESDEKRRLPGEDVRNALVTKTMRKEEPLLFGQYRRMKKELDREERRTKRLEKQINARQSQLSWLKTEAQAT